MLCNACNLHIRNNEPRAPSFGLWLTFTSKERVETAAGFAELAPSSASSGATRLNHPTVLIAAASFNPGLCNVVMSIVVKSLISASACLDIPAISSELGYRPVRRLMCACKSKADAYDVVVLDAEAVLAA